jgi:hypothetical protein
LILWRTSALPVSTPSSRVSKFAVFSRRMNSSSMRSTRVCAENRTRRWNPREMIPSRIAFVRPMWSPNVSSSMRMRAGRKRSRIPSTSSRTFAGVRYRGLNPELWEQNTHLNGHPRCVINGSVSTGRNRSQAGNGSAS